MPSGGVDIKMTRDRWLEDPKALEQAERLYAFIGKYVISIQWFESKIDELFLLAKGHDKWSETQAWLAGLFFKNKIRRFHNLALADGRPMLHDTEDWTRKITNLRRRLDAERERRNGILHAQFLFDFLAIGHPVLRSRIKDDHGAPEFDQEYLSPERCDEILTEVAQLAFEFGITVKSVRNAIGVKLGEANHKD